MERKGAGYRGCECSCPAVGEESRRKAKPPDAWHRGVFNQSLTITYFHTGCSTIIGAKSFHGPVRDGKGWYQLAMVIRHNLSLLLCSLTYQANHSRSQFRISSVVNNRVTIFSHVSSGFQLFAFASLTATITTKVIGTSLTGN